MSNPLLPAPFGKNRYIYAKNDGTFFKFGKYADRKVGDHMDYLDWLMGDYEREKIEFEHGANPKWMEMPQDVYLYFKACLYFGEDARYHPRSEWPENKDAVATYEKPQSPSLQFDNLKTMAKEFMKKRREEKQATNRVRKKTW